VYISRRLLRVIDIGWLERKVRPGAGQTSPMGKLLPEMESNTIQHQILIMVFWLGAMTALLYILVQ